MKLILKNSLIYFSIVFGCGFILGTIRVLFLVNTFGERNAELLETPFMWLVTIFSASSLIRKSNLQKKYLVSFWIGFFALLFLIIVEFTIVLWVRNLTFTDYLASKDPISGTVYIFSLMFFMLAPLGFSLKAKNYPISKTQKWLPEKV